MPNLTGQSLGRYHILEQLGEGGMATVYKAYDTRLERNVAVKVIRVDQFAPTLLDNILKRFDGEAKVVASLIHPNIVGVIDYGEFEGSPYMVMPYLPGGSLVQRLGQPLPWQEAIKLVLPIAEALDYAHNQNIIHRDVKPSNILLTQRGQPMLTDFGIAKILESEAAKNLTGTGMGIGTPEYMAPEQWTGKACLQSDLYSLGVVLYELVTGKKPYTADTPAAIMLKQANDPLPRPRQFVSNLPEAFEKVLFKALAKRPEDRYQNMSEFVVALESLTDEQTSEERRKVEDGKEVETLFAGGGRNLKTLESPNVPRQPAEQNRWSIKWWLWLIGFGGFLVVACVVIAALILPGFIAKLAPAPTFTPTSTLTFTPTFISTFTSTSTFPLEFTSTPDLEIGSTLVRQADGIVMVYVPEGEFNMGDTTDQALAECQNFFNDCQQSWFFDEQPPHSVSLDAYWIDSTEVSIAAYASCISAGACEPPISNSSNTRSSYFGNSQFADYPVINVSWFQAKAYCEWAGGRLPTEAEWEKAARGTDGRIYPWGNSLPTCSLANFGDPKYCTGDTRPVKSFTAGISPYGLLNMSGNVTEWVNDWYGETYFSLLPQINPTGPDTGEYRILRGGSWYLNTNFIRSTNRDHRDPNTQRDHIGFRCALSLNP
jgi:serine/threonine protein kinase